MCCGQIYVGSFTVILSTNPQNSYLSQWARAENFCNY